MRRFSSDYRFIPQDHILVSYLSMKVRGEELPFDGYVFDMERCDLYGKKPWDVFAMHTEYPDQTSVYLFTTTPKENDTAAAITRTTTGGGDAWIVENNGKSVPVEDPRYGNQIIGYKKTFFYNNSDQPNVEWVMTECASVEPPKVPSLDYVACKLEKIEFSDGDDDTDPMFPICEDDDDDDDTDPMFTICVDLEDMDINTEEMAVAAEAAPAA